MIVIQTVEEFKSELEKAGNKLIVVDFYATWCGPCKMISPKLEELQQEMPDVIFMKVDVDDCLDLANEYGVESMPTFVFIKNGKMVEKFAGANFDKLKGTIQKHN